MKGVIAARTDAPIIDLSHEIPPFDAWEAAFFLRDIAGYWAAGTIFVVVVDPGVGTSRRIIAVESNQKIFLAPDNGALHFIDGRALSVENGDLFLPEGSTTFHGRDRFAPAAAALANGKPIGLLGPAIDDRMSLDYTPPSKTHGTIIRIDRFGNAITDVPATGDRRPNLRVHGRTVSRWSQTYDGKEPFLIIGSTGCIEISVAQASAAALLQLRRGEAIEILDA